MNPGQWSEEQGKARTLPRGMGRREPWTDERIQDVRNALLVRFVAQGLTKRAAGRILGLSLATVKRRLNALDPERRQRLESGLGL